MTTWLPIVAGAAAAIAPVPTSSAAAPATLTRGVPIVITTAAGDAASRTFELQSLPAARVRLHDRGVVVRLVDGIRKQADADDVHARELAATEQLRGRRGTLTVRWHGVQERVGARWGIVSGSWSIVAGTGIYADRHGRGCFSSDGRLSVSRYRGLLIVAE